MDRAIGFAAARPYITAHEAAMLRNPAQLACLIVCKLPRARQELCLTHRCSLVMLLGEVSGEQLRRIGGLAISDAVMRSQEGDDDFVVLHPAIQIPAFHGCQTLSGNPANSAKKKSNRAGADDYIAALDLDSHRSKLPASWRPTGVCSTCHGWWEATR